MLQIWIKYAWLGQYRFILGNERRLELCKMPWHSVTAFAIFLYFHYRQIWSEQDSTFLYIVSWCMKSSTRDEKCGAETSTIISSKLQIYYMWDQINVKVHHILWTVGCNSSWFTSFVPFMVLRLLQAVESWVRSKNIFLLEIITSHGVVSIMDMYGFRTME